MPPLSLATTGALGVTSNHLLAAPSPNASRATDDADAAAEPAPVTPGVSTTPFLTPINNWDFAERVWAGLRPHLRTRLWVLETLQARSRPSPAPSGNPLEGLVAEVRKVEVEVDEVLRRRDSLSEFSSLLKLQLAPCLGRLEQLQQALHERGDA